jgi:hypothetical protein
MWLAENLGAGGSTLLDGNSLSTFLTIVMNKTNLAFYALALKKARKCRILKAIALP